MLNVCHADLAAHGDVQALQLLALLPNGLQCPARESSPVVDGLCLSFSPSQSASQALKELSKACLWLAFTSPLHLCTLQHYSPGSQLVATRKDEMLKSVQGASCFHETFVGKVCAVT